MDHILVTGGLGRSGRWIIDEFRDQEYTVTCLDQVAPDWGTASSYYDTDFRQVDLTNGGEVFELIHATNPDAVVHWGAYPSPRHAAGNRIFENNVESTYRVVTAAGQIGADVVLASSEAVYGYAFADEPSTPDRFPIKTSFPQRPTDPYGLSKQVCETIGRMAARAYNINVSALRPAWLQYPGEYDCLEIQEAPEYGRPHFWAYCDVRDLGRCIVAAVEASQDGFGAYHVMAADNYMGEPTSKLIEREFDSHPDVIDLEGDETAYSLTRTRENLNWDPVHSWRDAKDESIDAPLQDV